MKPKREPPERTEYYLSQVGLVVGSVVLSAICYALIEAIVFGPDAWMNGVLAGAFAGFLLSPVLLFVLRKKRLAAGLVLVFVPTFLVSIATGMLIREIWDAMFYGYYLPMISIIAMSVLARIVLPNTWRYPLRYCQQCAYDLHGLENSHQCPECGAKATPQAAEPVGMSDDDHADSPHPADPAG